MHINAHNMYNDALETPAEKSQRHSLLIEIIRSSDIFTQSDLVHEMEKKGIKCTQTTISRDLAELAVMKVGGHYRLPMDHPEWSPWERAVSENGVSVDSAGENLVVVKTRTGAANSVAIEMDRADLTDVAGTVAGDDTIFVAVRSAASRDRVFSKIQAALRQQIRR